jgi:putative oxidoreductase
MQVGLLLIHVVIGVLLAGHGAQKLFGIFGGYGLEGTGGYMEGFGLRPGKAFGAAAGAAELSGGLLLAAGLFTPLAAALIAGTMFVAARTDHAGKGLWIFNGGAEYVLTVSAVVLGLAFNGAGAWSLDAAIGWHVSGLVWGLGALAAAAGGLFAILLTKRATAVESRARHDLERRRSGPHPRYPHREPDSSP